MLKKLPLKSTILMSQIFESLRMRVENENESSHKKLRVEIENEMRVFLESPNFEIEMRVSQKSGTLLN